MSGSDLLLHLTTNVRLPCSVWRYVERFAAGRLGKGNGASTCDWETAVCAHLFGGYPRIALDVGANVGDWTASLRKIAPEAAVHIFEPSTAARESLLQRFRDCDGISIHHQAVSDYTGEAKLYSDASGSPLSSLSRRELGHLGIRLDCHETVAVTRLDELWPHFGATEIDWVKLDVEGHELSALRGLGARLANVRLIQFEFGGCNLDTRTNWKDFWSFFSLAGWQLHRISPSGPRRIKKYREIDEAYRTTNVVALRCGMSH